MSVRYCHVLSRWYTYHSRHHQPVIPPALPQPSYPHPQPQCDTYYSNRQQCQLHDHQPRASLDGIGIVWFRKRPKNFGGWEPHGGRCGTGEVQRSTSINARMKVRMQHHLEEQSSGRGSTDVYTRAAENTNSWEVPRLRGEFASPAWLELSEPPDQAYQLQNRPI